MPCSTNIAKEGANIYLEASVQYIIGGCYFRGMLVRNGIVHRLVASLAHSGETVLNYVWLENSQNTVCLSKTLSRYYIPWILMAVTSWIC